MVSNQRVTREISLPAGGEALPASPSLPNLLLEKTASFLGVPAPASPDVATNDAPPIPTADDFNRRDPQTSSLRDFDPARMAQDHALAWGRNQFNTSAEAWLSHLTDNARARMNLGIDRHGRVSGDADVFLPLYDTPRALFFTQLGVRSMAVSGGESDGKDRWIANLGLGHRFFPNATPEDSGNLMLGVNAFVDHDLTRAHNRGGIGVELQYDWLRLSSNFYAPLSGWRDSHDFDPRRREERPAKGRDVRIEAALPFYRPVTLTGGYTQWKGDEVSVFGHRKLERNPRVWFYGLEYTPMPLFTASLTQQRTERGQTEARFGLSFTYPFDLPLGKQIKPSKGTVSGDRYDFADRENRIILADRTKSLDGTATKTVASVVTDLDLSQYIPSPILDEVPKITITGSQYTGTITWSPSDSSFKQEVYYTATVVLTPLPGWTFDGVKVNTFVCYGSLSISNNANSGDISITFVEAPTEEPA